MHEVSLFRGVVIEGFHSNLNIPITLCFQNWRKYTSLTIACWNGHAATVKVLLDHNAVVDYQNEVYVVIMHQMMFLINIIYSSFLNLLVLYS